MRVSVRAGGERAASVTVVLVELDKGPGPEMDVGRGVRAGLGAIALELIVGHGPVLPGLTVPPLAGESPCGPAGHLPPTSGRRIATTTQSQARALTVGPVPDRPAEPDTAGARPHRARP